jgi:adenylate cyclase
MSFFEELRRRNVFRVAMAYAFVAWLLIEVADTVFPRIGLPEWTVTFVIAALALGFPLRGGHFLGLRTHA